MAILTDSSFIYAIYNANDSRHPQAIDFSATNTEEMWIPDIILPEVCYLFLRDLGYIGVQRFLENFKQVNIRWVSVIQADLVRMHEISLKYANAQFDLVDCCIMSQAERLNITRVATFDRRDFSIFRPRHCNYLELLPSL